MMPMDNKKPSLISSFFRLMLRAILYLAVFVIIYLIILSIALRGRTSARDGSEIVKIINDLRNLKGAAGLFQIDIGRWPVPGEEASLDLYSYRPIVTGAPLRYANVMLSGEIYDSGGTSRQYVGVELMPQKNGTKNIQKKLAGIATNVGILQEIPSNDVPPAPYQSGLNIYIW
jgi:hypothetical protein